MEPTVTRADASSKSIHTITFRPDRVYEVTGIWVREGQLPGLEAYFERVFPIALGDYGVRPLFALEPASAYRGDFVPDVLFVNEWPALESFQGFLNDPRSRALFPERDALVERLVVTQYQVPAEASIELADGDLLEFGAMWIKPGRAEDLSAYYEGVMPLARRHGVRPVTPLSPVFSYRGDFLPDRAGLNVWTGLDDFERFTREAAPLFAARDDALERLEVTHSFVRFPDAGK